MPPRLEAAWWRETVAGLDGALRQVWLGERNGPAGRRATDSGARRGGDALASRQNERRCAAAPRALCLRCASAAAALPCSGKLAGDGDDLASERGGLDTRLAEPRGRTRLGRAGGPAGLMMRTTPMHFCGGSLADARLLNCSPLEPGSSVRRRCSPVMASPPGPIGIAFPRHRLRRRACDSAESLSRRQHVAEGADTGELRAALSA